LSRASGASCDRGLHALAPVHRGQVPAAVIALLLLAAGGGLALAGPASLFAPIALAGVNAGMAVQLLVPRHDSMRSLREEVDET
jgi:hypothetical protein